MPEISRFFGIVIAMYQADPDPPHFHARYGHDKIVVDIRDGRVAGSFPPRALALVLEWWRMNRRALIENWNLMRQAQPLKRIPPLE